MSGIKKNRDTDSVTGNESSDEKEKESFNQDSSPTESDDNVEVKSELVKSEDEEETSPEVGEEQADNVDNTDGVAGFVNPKYPGKVTTKLWRLKGEADADTVERVKGLGWIVGSDYHFGKTGIHFGKTEDCKECKRISGNTKKEVPETRFLELNSLSDVQTEWAKSPNGLNVIYMAYYVKDDPKHHMTVFYIPCGIGQAAAMYMFGKRIAAELPKLKAKIGPPNTELDLAGRDALSLQVRLKGDIRAILNKLTIRDWQPHMTIMEEGEYKEGDVIELVPQIQLIRSDLSHIENARSYSEWLGVDVSIGDLKGDPQNVDKHKEKVDSESESNN